MIGFESEDTNANVWQTQRLWCSDENCSKMQSSNASAEWSNAHAPVSRSRLWSVENKLFSGFEELIQKPATLTKDREGIVIENVNFNTGCSPSRRKCDSIEDAHRQGSSSSEFSIENESVSDLEGRLEFTSESHTVADESVDSLLQTPAGYYDKNPLSDCISVPPFFEHNSADDCDYSTDSECTFLSKVSGYSSRRDSGCGSPDSSRDDGLSLNSRAGSPFSETPRRFMESTEAGTFSPVFSDKEAVSPATHICDNQLIVSVLQHVFSEDTSTAAEMMSALSVGDDRGVCKSSSRIPSMSVVSAAARGSKLSNQKRSHTPLNPQAQEFMPTAVHTNVRPVRLLPSFVAVHPSLTTSGRRITGLHSRHCQQPGYGDGLNICPQPISGAVVSGGMVYPVMAWPVYYPSYNFVHVAHPSVMRPRANRPPRMQKALPRQ